MKGKKWLFAVLLVVWAFALATTAVAAKPKLNKKTATIYVGEKLKLKVTGTKSKGTFQSSSKKVAKVDKSGKVTALKAGKATIKVKVAGKTLTCKVKVKSPQLSHKSVTLKEGATKTIKLYGTKIQSVSNSNTKIASFNKKGKIQAKKAGRCTLTVKGKNGKSYKCKVTVLAKAKATPTPSQTPSQTPEMEGGASPTPTADPGLAKPDAPSDPNAVPTDDPSVPQPEDPGQPSDPLEDPAQPSDPSEDPAQPSDPSEDPGQPSDPSGDPGQPSDPSEDPGQPSDPSGDPAQPSDPSEDPGQPSDPSENPGQPSEPPTEPPTEEPFEGPEGSAASGEDIPKLVEQGIKKIILQSYEKKKFVIPEGNYPDVVLIVDIPNGALENQARFKRIEIENISPDKDGFIEHADGNIIEVLEEVHGTLTVEEEANVTILVNGPSVDFTIQNHGKVNGISLNDESATLLIAGDSLQTIPIEVAEQASGAAITTERNLDITANAKLDLVLGEGADRTVASITDRADIPDVSGLGSVTVRNTLTGEIDIVLAENAIDNPTKVRVTGQLHRSDGTAMEGVSVYMLKYRRAIDAENITADDLDNARLALTEADGSYEFAQIPIGNYYLVAEADGYMQSVQIQPVARTATGTFENEPIEMLTQAEGTGTLSGTVVDAMTGKEAAFPVSLKLRKGRNNVSGRAKATLEDVTGSFAFGTLEAGAYTIQAYTKTSSEVTIVSTSETVIVAGGKDNVCSVAVSAAMDGAGMRFVLTWGDQKSDAPGDLDSHLFGPDISGYGERYHVYQGTQAAYDANGTLLAELDVDDTSYEGPETTTIRELRPGVYSFFVYDYEDMYNEESTNLSNKSKAVVRIYDAAGYIPRATVAVPQGFAGNLWHVCDYDAATDQLTIVNQVQYWPSVSSDDFYMPLPERLREMIEESISMLEWYCEEKLEPGAPLKEEIDAAIQHAKTVCETSSDVSELRAERQALEVYLKQLNVEQDLKTKRLIDGATPISPNEMVDVRLGSQEIAYGFTPETSGDYLFAIRRLDAEADPWMNVYEGYQTFSESITSTDNLILMGGRMEAGQKYTVALSEYMLEDAPYRLALIEGLGAAEILDLAAWVKYTCEEYLSEGDALYQEIMEAIQAAESTLLENGVAWDEEKARELTPKLEAYREQAWEDQPNWLEEELDGATPIEVGARVSVEATDETKYFSFQPQSDATYTFLAYTQEKRSSADTMIYEGYDSYYGDRSYWGRGIYLETIAAKAGVRYTVSIQEYNLEQCPYVLAILEGDTAVHLYNWIDEVEPLCTRRLPRNDSLRTEIMEKIADAWMLIEFDEWKEDVAQGLLADMESYYEQLLYMDDLKLNEAIDNAQPLQIGVPYIAKIVEDATYYSFVPVVEGSYVVRIETDEEDAYLYTTVYEGHESYYFYHYECGKTVFYYDELTAGVPYTFALEELGVDGGALYTMTVLQNETMAGLIEVTKSVTELVDSRLEADDTLRTQIEQDIDRVGELLTGTWSEATGQTYLAKMQAYEEQLLELPSLEMEYLIDLTAERGAGDASAQTEPNILFEEETNVSDGTENVGNMNLGNMANSELTLGEATAEQEAILETNVTQMAETEMEEIEEIQIAETQMEEIKEIQIAETQMEETQRVPE